MHSHFGELKSRNVKICRTCNGHTVGFIGIACKCRYFATRCLSDKITICLFGEKLKNISYIRMRLSFFKTEHREKLRLDKIRKFTRVISIKEKFAFDCKINIKNVEDF